MTSIWKDVCYGIRLLAKSPTFTVVAMLTLGLGVGASTALFTIVKGVLLQPLPFPQPNQLVSLTGPLQKGPFVLFREQVHSFTAVGYSDSQFNLTLPSGTIRVKGAIVSADFFSALGIQPVKGRTFKAGEDQPGLDSITVLSYSFWQTRFKSDPTVIGRPVTVDGSEREIVGIMPLGFSFPSSTTAIWVPLHLDPANIGDYWGSSYLTVLGRLHPSVSIRQARGEVKQLVPKIRNSFPWKMPDRWGADITLTTLQQEIVGNARTELLILFGAAGLVLLIACANVANLLLARATGREKEMTVRAVLGANRFRILQQLLTESALLAIGGGALGLASAFIEVNLLKSILSANIPRIENVSMDGRVLTFTLALVIFSGLLFGLAPALTLSQRNFAESLKSGTYRTSNRTSYGIQRALVIAEVALSVVLVISTALLIQSLWKLTTVQLGFREEHIVTARVTPNQDVCTLPGRCEGFYHDLLQHTSGLPGVENVAATSALPLEGGMDDVIVANVHDYVPPQGELAPLLLERVVTPDYFKVMGIPLIGGRYFTQEDSAADAAPVVIISASTAHHLWPGRNSLEETISPVWLPGEKIRVVGIVADTREFTLEKNLPNWIDGEVYVPYGPAAIRANGSKGPLAEMTLVMRTLGGHSDIAPELANVIASLDRDVPPPSDVRTLATIVSGSSAASRSIAWLLGFFGTSALALGALGIYGLISYLVLGRSHEFGVRMALGAQRRDVFRLVLAQGARLSFLGVMLGVIVALIVTRLLESFLYGIGATDPTTFIGAALFLMGVALTASYLPARRATSIYPAVSLRCE